MMLQLTENIKEFRILLDRIQEMIHNEKDDIKNLEKLKTKLQLVDKSIKYRKSKGLDIQSELQSDKIELVLRIDEIESTIRIAQEMYQMGEMITENFKAFDLRNGKKFKDIKLIDEFNGKDILYYSASKAYKLFLETVKKTNLTDLVKVINEVCNFKSEEKMYLLHNRIITKSDYGFHEAFFSQIKSGLGSVIKYNKTTKKSFMISDILRFYVLFTLGRNNQNE
jgi:hypothetical protein